MASNDKMLELGENSAKRDGDSDEAKLNSELKTIDVDKSVIELDSDLDSSDCVIIADDANEPAAKTTDSNEKIFGVEQSPAETSAIEIADESAAVVVEPSIESDTAPVQPLEISSVAILEGKNADSSVTEEGKNVTENNPTEVLITEMQSDAPKGADETDFVAGDLTIPESATVSIKLPSKIDLEKPSDSKSVIVLDTPEKGEQTAVATAEPMIDETIEIDDDLQEEVADKSFCEISTNIDAETHSELDTPKKGDISIIDITTPPEKYDPNLADSEPACDGKKSNENVGKGSLENVDVSETHVDVPLENVLEAPKTDELDFTKNIESSQQPLAIAVAAETTEFVSQKSNAEIEEIALKDTDVVESDSETHQSVNLAKNAEKTHETDVDGAKERVNIVSQADGSIVTESADASAPATGKCNEPSEVKKNAHEKAFLEGECENIDVDKSRGSPTPIEDKLEEQTAASNENMDESMETNEVVLPSTETDAPIPMDVDGESEVREECENKADFEELSGTIDAVAAIKDSNKSDGDAKDPQDIDETNTEPLDCEAKLGVATDVVEENAQATNAESEEKSPDRALFIRVKSMAFLCSDGKKRIS